VRAGARARLHRYWEMFADTFGAEPFLSGAEPGALDMLAAVVSRWAGARKHLAAQRPALHATLLRIEADAALAPVFARHWPA
jgi:GST-like protein